MMNFKEILIKIKNIIVEAFFPSSKCVFCGRDVPDDVRICDSCLKEDIFNEGNKCIKCDTIIKDDNIVCDHCKNSVRHFEKLFAPFRYTGIVRSAILKFKSDEAIYLAPAFAKYIYDRLQFEDLDFDLIVPVPSEKRKIKQRGYNPAKVLANELSKLSGKPVADVLYKTKPTKNQKSLDYSDRQTNLKDSIVLLDKSAIKDKIVLIIDDIITTGATIETCALTMKKAKKIYGCAIARSNFQK